MEQAINFIGQQRQQHEAPPQRREPEGPSFDEQIRKLERERDEALANQKITEYHD
jgi:hypothetical protein